MTRNEIKDYILNTIIGHYVSVDGSEFDLVLEEDAKRFTDELIKKLDLDDLYCEDGYE